MTIERTAMNRIFERKYDLRTNDFDRYNRVRPSSVLDLLQDVAGRHGEEIGVGLDVMQSKSYFWVLVKTKFKILKQPDFHQSVIVKTWPLEPNRFIYRREYTIESEAGEKLIVASSDWMVVHSEKRTLVSARDLYVGIDEFCDESHFGTKLGKIKDFDTETMPYSLTPSFSYIDANGHVNNTKYTEFVLDAINPDENFQIDTLLIDYRKEVLPGEKLDIFYKNEENTLTAKGTNENGDMMFACEIECK